MNLETILGIAKKRTKKRLGLRAGLKARLASAKTKAKGKLDVLRKARLAKLAKAKAAKAIARRGKKARLLSRMPASKKAAIRSAILKNPKLVRKVQAAQLKKALQRRQAGVVVSPGAVQRTTVPSRAAAPRPTPEPTQPAIPTEETMSPAEAVEEEAMEQPLEDAAEDSVEQEEGTEEAIEDIAEAPSEEEELTEPDADDDAEEAEDEAEENVDEATAAAGMDTLRGQLFQRRIARLRRRQRPMRACMRAMPLARKIENATLGGIPTHELLGAVRAVASAKAGNKKAKRAIKTAVRKAKKGDKKAKKVVARLKVANKVIKKSRKTSLAKKGKKPAARKKVKSKAKIARKIPYSKPVAVDSKGLFSYSAHQRGLAMIPGEARARYGRW